MNTIRLLDWGEKQRKTITSKFVPGCLNVKADALSRRNQILKQEWSLLQQVFSQNLQDMGDTTCGFIRNQSKPQASPVFFSNTRSTSIRSRCHDQQLERDVSVCLSTNTASESYNKQASSGQSRSHSSSSSMAESRMVSRSSVIYSGHTITTTTVGETVKTTTSPIVSQPTVGTQPSRLEIISRHLKDKGFSQQASEAIASHHRASTSSLYQSKWKQFVDWCDTEQVDSLKATVPQVADFFLYLFNDKGLKMSTIKGYRAAISKVLKYQGTDISNDDEISLLFRSLDIKRPTTMSTVPKWDLALALRHLTGPPYEPMHLASPKALTQKTVFLLGLASAKRIGELHALTKHTYRTLGISYHQL